jgi:hypothetical protein
VAAHKNHHFVPQFYFRRFSNDGRSICCLVRSTGKVIQNASIKGQASKNLFYGSGDVEGALAQVEGICSAALRGLDAVADIAALDAEHSMGLLVHLSLQHSRTQAARQAAQPFQDRLMQLWAEVALNNNQELDEATRAQMQDMLPHLGADPVQAQGMSMGIAMQSADALSDLHALILVNKTNRPFIFGDAPVVFYNAACWDVKLRGVLGMASFGLMVLMPLDSGRCLLLLDEGAYEVRGERNNAVSVRDLRDVAALNKLQLHAASDCAYFEDATYERYVKALWQEESMRLQGHKGHVVQAPSFDAQSGEELGEIVHGFNPQVPYRVGLSFLRHDTFNDEDERPMQRPTCVFPGDNFPESDI